MELPLEHVGRAMTDIQRMSGKFAGPESEGDAAVLTGTAPVSEMRGYQKEFAAYTGGYGRLFCTLKGYDVCHNQEEVIERIGYDADADLENTADSVFCAHGAGFVVPWYQVEEYMHVDSTQEEGGKRLERGHAHVHTADRKEDRADPGGAGRDLCAHSGSGQGEM